MTIPQRTVSITGVFASNATTTIPETPVAGTSYRDEAMTTEQVSDGWPYKTIVDSSQFNQAMYQYSTIAQMQEKYGFIPWSNLTDYEEGSFCLGTDGSVYQAVQATGPSSAAYDPVEDTSNTYWRLWLENYQLGIGDIKQSLRTSNHGNWILCDGQAISRDEYPVLFSIIGTTFGNGDGSTTFNVPDYRGKFLRGLGGNSAANMYTTQAEGLPNITGDTGTMGVRCNSGTVPASNSAIQIPNNIVGSTDTGIYIYGGVMRFDASRSSAIYGKSQHVTPINQAVNFFVRAR